MIGIVPIGYVPALVPKVVAAHVSGFLNLPATLLDPYPLSRLALDKHRLQYNAGQLHREMENAVFEGCCKVIGVLSVDLFVPIFTHVFGEARQGGRLALISLFRVKTDSDIAEPCPLTLERIAKVALHELGHLFDLHHCEDKHCLMHFSGSLTELDQQKILFCRYCLKYFHDAVDRLGVHTIT